MKKTALGVLAIFVYTFWTAPGALLGWSLLDPDSQFLTFILFLMFSYLTVKHGNEIIACFMGVIALILIPDAVQFTVLLIRGIV